MTTSSRFANDPSRKRINSVKRRQIARRATIYLFAPIAFLGSVGASCSAQAGSLQQVGGSHSQPPPAADDAGSPVAPIADSVVLDTTAHGRSITCLTTDLQGNVWIGTEGGGVLRHAPDPMDRSDGSTTHFTTKERLSEDSCCAIACDRQGRTWVGTTNHGVSVFNGKTWNSYGLMEGLPGLHVTALAVSPTDGDVWGATEAGLFCYTPATDRWLTIGQGPGGLPSNAINALAFNRRGELVVGTQADGIATRSASEAFSSWKRISGPDQMTHSPSGAGLPSNRINCLSVSKNGTIYAGTPDGLAYSEDDGSTWSYIRGADWEERARGREAADHAIVKSSANPKSSTNPPVLLAEDYVTCAVEDSSGTLLVGHWRRGMEAINRQSGAMLYTFPKPVLNSFHKVRAEHVQVLLPLPGGAILCGNYTLGAFVLTPPVSGAGGNATIRPADRILSPIASSALQFPSPAGTPSLNALNDMLRAAEAVPVDPDELHPKIVALDDDWLTQGTWLGRYGRYFCDLCATQGGLGDYYWGSGWELVNSFWQIGPNRNVNLAISPTRKGDQLRYWNTINYTKDPRALELPAPYMDNRVQNKSTSWEVNRRIASIDDHGEDYPVAYDGPHLYGKLHIPHGLFFLSLYHLNDNGHGNTAASCRDYRVSLWLSPGPESIAKINSFPTGPEDAHCRIENSYNGVWKRFLVRGPTNVILKIDRSGSENTTLSAVTLDQVDERPPPYFESPEQQLTETVERRRSLKALPAARRFVMAPTEAEAANRLFDCLEELRLVNSTWWSSNSRPLYRALLRWYKAQEQIGAEPSARLSRHIATCSYQLNLFPQWEQYQNKAGLTTTRQIEQALRWKEGAKQADDYEMVSEYVEQHGNPLQPPKAPLSKLNSNLTRGNPCTSNTHDQGEFENLLQTIARERHVAIVAEGTPAAPIGQSDTDLSTSARPPATDLTSISSRYDYSVEQKDGVFVLKKKYSRSEDLPDVSREECALAATWMKNALYKFAPKLSWTDILLYSFPSSLTPAELAQMKKGALAVRALTPAQQEMLKTSALSAYLGEIPLAAIAADWEASGDQNVTLLRGSLPLPESEIDYAKAHGHVFRPGDISQLFGFECFLPQVHKQVFFSLSGPYSRKGVFHGFSYSTGGKQADDLTDPTDPAAFPELSQISTAHSTVGAVISSLNGATNNHTHFLIDSSLAEKSVTVAGLTNAAPEQILHALAAVYGLRIVSNGSAGGAALSETLTLPEMRLPKDLADLPDSLDAALPEPLRRALHVDEQTAIHAEMHGNFRERLDASVKQTAADTPDSEETVAQLKAEMERRHAVLHGAEKLDRDFSRMNALNDLPAKVRFAAVARLRLLAEPVVDASPKGSVPLAEFNQASKNAFALAILSDLAMHFYGLLTDAIPASLSHFSEATLGGGLTPSESGGGGQQFALVFRVRDEYGNVQDSTAFYQVPYGPQPKNGK